MSFDLIIKNADVVLEYSTERYDIAVKDGKIEGILTPDNDEVDAISVIDAKGKHLLPGGIDTHSHFFEPGQSYREDFYHGTQAAAMGGYATVMDMPNTDPPVCDEETFAMKKQIFSRNAHVDYMIWGASLPGCFQNISRMQELGCPAFKAFISDAGPTFPKSDSLALLEGMTATEKAGSVFAVHAEDPDIVEGLRKRYENETWNLTMHEKARPWYAELSAINKAILFSGITGCPLHICHTSIPEGVELVNEARKNGADITIETCPHYLLCDIESVFKSGSYAVVCPPIRDHWRKEKMWEYVKDGSINYMGTDHAPYTKSDKAPDNLWDTPGGTPNIDVAIPMILEEGVKNRGISLSQMSAFISTNAAKRFGIYPKKGTIRLGSDADFMIVDMNRSWIYSRMKSYSKTKETEFPYEGRRIGCSVETTIVRGQVVYHDNKIHVKAGYGELVKPDCRQVR